MIAFGDFEAQDAAFTTIAVDYDVEFDDEGHPFVIYDGQPSCTFIRDSVGIGWHVDAATENNDAALTILTMKGSFKCSDL